MGITAAESRIQVSQLSVARSELITSSIDMSHVQFIARICPCRNGEI